MRKDRTPNRKVRVLLRGIPVKKVRFGVARAILTEEEIPFKPEEFRILKKNSADRIKLMFLQRFLRYLTPGRALSALGLSRQVLAGWKERDSRFLSAFEVVEEAITEELERAGMNRAHQDSDDLLKFFLKARNRKKYGEKVDHELSGAFSLRDFYSVGRERPQVIAAEVTV